MGPKCPQCGEELIMDVQSFWVRTWTDYVCPSCAKRYSVPDLVKAIRAKQSSQVRNQ